MRFLYTLFMLLAAAPAWAQRPNTLDMTCAEARGFVAAEGSIVMSTGRHTFERFVASPGYCDIGEHAVDGYAPTIDRDRCRVGYRCELGTPFEHDFHDPFWRP